MPLLFDDSGGGSGGDDGGGGGDDAPGALPSSQEPARARGGACTAARTGRAAPAGTASGAPSLRAVEVNSSNCSHM